MKKIILSTLGLLIALTSLFILKKGYLHAQTNSKISIYQATWNSDNIIGELHVNGFLINEFNGSQSAGTSPLNPYLIGKNGIRIEARKKDGSQPAQLSLNVSRLSRGDIASTGDTGNLLSIELKDDDFAGAGTVKKNSTFNTPIDFSDHLIGTGTAQEKEVIEYAKKIYTLFKVKNADGIQKEFIVKINDYSKAYSSSQVAAEFKSYLMGNLLKDKLEKIDPRALKAKKAGPANNLWHIYEGNKILLRFKSADGSTSELDIYIGKIDGKLRIVR